MRQFNKYWSNKQQVDIVGFNKPEFELLDNFNFVSIADYNYSVERWTNFLIAYLESIQDDHIILFLEDYWLNKPIDDVAVLAMWEYAAKEPNLLRIDLTADRTSQRYTLYHEYFGYQIIQTKAGSPYQMSYQTAIWNRKNLLEVLVPGETPWQSEIDGSKRLTDAYLVLGTKVHPISYVPVFRSHKTGLHNMNKFNKEDRQAITKLLPKEKR
jgi:hypothetical protein